VRIAGDLRFLASEVLARVRTTGTCSPFHRESPRPPPIAPRSQASPLLASEDSTAARSRLRARTPGRGYRTVGYGPIDQGAWRTAAPVRRRRGEGTSVTAIDEARPRAPMSGRPARCSCSVPLRGLRRAGLPRSRHGRHR
jgi:hypothetical protein